MNDEPLESRRPTTPRVCLCVSDHRPALLDDGEWHHVWPLGMGGPDVPENQVYLCANAHNNVHVLLRWLAGLGRRASYEEAKARFDQPVSRYAFLTAAIGYDRYLRGAL